MKNKFSYFIPYIDLKKILRMFRHHSIILLYSIFLSIIFCNEGNVNANEFMDSIQSHFEHFGTPFEPLEQDKEQKQIIKRNVKTGKVEWRLAEINRNMEINEWTNEFSMLDDRKAEIEKKILAPAMTEYANCVMKMKKMEIKPKDKTTKIFMLNGAITILDMKPIARKDEAYLVNYVPEFLQNEHQILDVVPTHFCTSLFIVENWDKIGKRELVCTRIDSWTENDGPPKDIGNSKDCGHSKLHDSKLEKNILEIVQIKLAVDLSKMLKRFEKTDFMDVKEQKKDDHNLPLASRIAVDEHQIGKMDPNIRIYKGFIVEYDPRKLVANWLLERLTMENVLSKNSTKRLKKWNVDLELAIMFQPFDEDYKIAKQFNLNHGHLAGFRAHRKDDVHVQDTFLYPNSVPQDKEINNGYWSLIEEYALCLAGHKQSIAYVYTGPLYIPEKNKDNGQWQMKYKVIGTMKMMAVPTHLFKVIFLEFTNENDGKKSFWLESLVVSNGQEGEIEVVEEENVERKKEGFEIKEEFKEEEGKDITVEVEKDNHSWYILAKNETELDKFQSQKESYIPIPENIQALVKNCQDRTYKVTYGDVKSGGKFRKLLKQYRVPLNYIDKFAPNFQLLAKLPAQLRSMPNGSHFDEDKLAELLARNNTKKHEAFMEKSSSSNDEKEEKRKSDNGEELTRKLGNKKWVAREKGVAKKKEKQEIKSSISVDIDESTSTSADDLTEKSYSSTADEKEEKKKNRRRKNKISIFEKEDDKVEKERIAKEEEEKQNSVAVLDSLTSVSIAGNMRNELELIERREEYAKNEHQRTLELEMVKHQRTLELETDKHQKALELENVKYQKTLELENDKYQKALELEKTKHKKALKLKYTEHQKALELENAKHEKALELENVKIDRLKLQIQNMQLQIELAKLKSKEPPKQ